MATNLVQSEFNGAVYSFRDDGWFNATQAAARFGKEATAWLRQTDTVEYLAALHKRDNPNSGFLPEFRKLNELYRNRTEAPGFRAKLLRLVKQTGLVKARQGAQENGGGTWLHPKLAVPFARWLDVDFAVWCDDQIDGLIRGSHPAFDWKRARSEAASSFKVMNAVCLLVRQQQGKATGAHHYINEARLVNWALTGEFRGIDRDALPGDDLDLLAKLEECNAVLLGCGMDYKERKQRLERFARSVRAPLIAA